MCIILNVFICIFCVVYCVFISTHCIIILTHIINQSDNNINNWYNRFMINIQIYGIIIALFKCMLISVLDITKNINLIKQCMLCIQVLLQTYILLNICILYINNNESNHIIFLNDHICIIIGFCEIICLIGIFILNIICIYISKKYTSNNTHEYALFNSSNQSNIITISP